MYYEPRSSFDQTKYLFLFIQVNRIKNIVRGTGERLSFPIIVYSTSLDKETISLKQTTHVARLHFL